MARARNIKPAIMDNEDLADLEPLTRLLFIYLWMLADRDGRMEDRPKRIAAQALPYDRSADVEAMLCNLHKSGFINRYEAGGVAVIQISAFLKHQTPHGTEKDGVLPDENGMFTVNSRGKNGYATGDSSLINGDLTVKQQQANSALTVNPPLLNTLIPDSLIPDSLTTPIGVVVAPQSVAATPASPKPKRSASGTRLPQDWFLPDTWGQWGLQKYPHFSVEIIRDEATKFANHWRSKTGKDATKLDWLATWQNWLMSDICQKAHPPESGGGETNYQRSMRERVEQAAGSLAHIVAAKAPGSRQPQTPTPWEVAIENNARTTAIGMD